MKKTMLWKLGILVFGFVGLVNISHAALNDLNNGLVNDDSLNITWMKDANLVKTSCDANNALWQAFDPSALPPLQQSGRTKAEICNGTGADVGDGSLNWHEAQAWIAVLNAQNYLGHSNWRQTTAAIPDATCSTPANATGSHCTGSELGHLFNTTLGNPNQTDDGCFVALPYCFQNIGPFENTLPATTNPFGSWWTGALALVTTNGQLFSTSAGSQSFAFLGGSFLYVWPVRTGLSAASTAPQKIPTLSVWGLGIMSLLLAFVARRKVR